MDFNQGLSLPLHTSGDVTNAAESIVAYLRSRVADIEVIVPTLAMSAGDQGYRRYSTPASSHFSRSGRMPRICMNPCIRPGATCTDN
jgi:hypothetical protein